MYAANFLLLGAVLFCIGVYGVIARRNAVMVLMTVELDPQLGQPQPDRLRRS